MFVKPAQGRKIRYPDRDKYLPETGANVPDNDLFWVKRVKQGDVVVVKNPPKVNKTTTDGKKGDK